jgi:hypothetical protein
MDGISIVNAVLSLTLWDIAAFVGLGYMGASLASKVKSRVK